MMLRALVIVAVLVFSGWFVYGGEPPASAEPVSLAELPLAFGEWTGRDEGAFDDETLRVLGVDDYVNRTYMSQEDLTPVALYVGYYASQRQGDAIHSPLNCLPGAGWQPVARSRVALASGTGAEINRLVVQKGRDRQIVLYWYLGRGRVIASEYVNKGLLIFDAIRLNRTDGALVRLSRPLSGAESAADGQLLDFARTLQPLLASVLPGPERMGGQ